MSSWLTVSNQSKMRALSLPKLTGSDFIPFRLFDNLQETTELKLKLFNPLKAERFGMQTRAERVISVVM